MSIARNRRDNDRELERRITAVKALDSSRYKSIITLHFEGKSDSYLVEQFCQSHNLLKSRISFKNFTYTPGKSFAIKNHIEAMSLGFKISTIVDMDDDYEDIYISAKDSQNRYIKHPNIRSTNPGGVLLTLLLLGEGKLEKAVKNIPLLDKPSDEQVRIILNHATERTSKRIYGENYKANKNYIIRQKNEIKKNIPSLMNDHSLCESIYLHKSGIFQEEIEGWKFAKNNKTKKAIEKSLIDDAKELGSKILEELVISMIEETKSTVKFKEE